MSEQTGAVSPLFMACQLDQLSLARALLDYGATVNIAKVSEWEYCGVECAGMGWAAAGEMWGGVAPAPACASSSASPVQLLAWF